MPRLKRLLAAADAADGAAEHLFTRPLHDVTQREERREAAAACASPGLKMSTLLGDDELLDDATADYSKSQGLASGTFEDCVVAAVEGALHDKSSLFIVSSAALVAKGIQNAIIAMDLDGASRMNSLARIGVHQTRDIHVVLSMLDNVQSILSPPTQIFLGPLCLIFTPFLTANGLTVTGEGLLRMVQLAWRRVRANCPQTEVTIIHPGPLFGY